MKSLEAFIGHLSTLESHQEINDILEVLPEFEDLQIADWESLLEKENGTPQTTVLYHTDQIKLALIYWNGLQTSSLHGHPGGGGLIRVLAGCLEESRFDPVGDMAFTDRQILEVGSVGYIHDMLAYHQVKNPNRTPAVSLHVYSLT